MFNRIILGTANFAKEYNGTKVKDVDAILEYAKDIGIWAIDTSMAYETHGLEYPQKIVKVRKNDVYLRKDKPICFMCHGVDSYLTALQLSRQYDVPFGASVYDSDDLKKLWKTNVL